MDLYVVMIHCNKSGFSVKRIECDGKFKSIMDKVSDDMGIGMSYANLDNHIPEAESAVIKERF